MGSGDEGKEAAAEGVPQGPAEAWRVSLLERKLDILEREVKMLRRTLLKFFVGPQLGVQVNIDLEKDLGFDATDQKLEIDKLRPSGLILPS